MVDFSWMQACTIIARNYLAQARVLAQSFRTRHPDCRFTLLVVDQRGEDRLAGEEFEVLGIEDIGLDPGEPERMALIYDVTELSTAVKPWLLRRLQQSGSDVVIYFDPDIEIFAPLFEIEELAREHSIVLTPHVLQPMRRDSLEPTESVILASGIFNLGFIAVGPGSEAFLDWWAVRLRRDSHVDPANMRFTDQRWVDFVPALFQHHILRDSASNVAYWNLDQRKLAVVGSGYEVDGRPLRFFHYSGYDPDRPDVLSKFQADAPRVRLEEEPGVRAICDEYRRKLLAAGYEENRPDPYRYAAFADNVPIDLAMRRTYRAALLEFESRGGPEPPNAFVPEMQERFLQWLTEPLESDSALVTRYMLGVWESQPRLQIAFPEPLGTDASAFHEWFATYRPREVECHPALLPTADPACGTNFAASLRLIAARRRDSVVGKTIDFGASRDSEPYRLSGWSTTERRFTWSVGESAYVGLPIPEQPQPLELQVTAAAFTHPPQLESQRVQVDIGSRTVAEWHVGPRRLFRTKIPPEAIDGSGVLIIRFRTPDATSPETLRHDSKDPRPLGLCMYRLRVVEASWTSRLLRTNFWRRAEEPKPCTALESNQQPSD